MLYFLADCLVYPLLRYVVRYRLKIVRKNIRLSFPEKSEAQRNAIVNAFYHHFADVLVEIIHGYRAYMKKHSLLSLALLRAANLGK